jgi:type II secretory ATPase GspE/PulE/Tfp pilus assembly ATPase PilB-like protein
VASTLIGAMAQRLVRKICPKCATPYQPSASEVPPDFGLKAGEKLFRGQGCDHCRKTGYRRRSGLYELLVMNDRLAKLINERASVPDIVAAGRSNGLRLLREDGWLKARSGVTTVDEVLKCTAL